MSEQKVAEMVVRGFEALDVGAAATAAGLMDMASSLNAFPGISEVDEQILNRLLRIAYLNGARDAHRAQMQSALDALAVLAPTAGTA